MTPRRWLGLDVGTSSTKGLLVDDRGVVHGDALCLELLADHGRGAVGVERVERALANLGEADPTNERPRMQLSAALGWSLMYGVGRVREAGPVINPLTARLPGLPSSRVIDEHQMMTSR